MPVSTLYWSLTVRGGLSALLLMTCDEQPAAFQDFDNRVASVEGGVRYAFPSGVPLPIRRGPGMGIFLKESSRITLTAFRHPFDEMEHELRLIWPVTGKLRLTPCGSFLARARSYS